MGCIAIGQVLHVPTFFMSMHDCTVWFAVVLDQPAVWCFLLHKWGWSAIGRVICDIIMSPHKMGCCASKKASCCMTLPPPPEYNLGNTSKDCKSEGAGKNYLWDCTLLLESHNQPMCWWNSSCHLSKIDESALGATWGMRASRGITVILVWLITKGGHK